MNNALQHIGEQLKELRGLTNTDDKRRAGGVLEGLCMAYFKMGQITQEQCEEMSKIAEETKVKELDFSKLNELDFS